MRAIIPCSTKVISVQMIFWGVSVLYFGGRFNKTIIPLTLVGHEMIIANSAQWQTLCALLAIYHLKSNREQLLNIDFIHLTDHIPKS